MTSISAAEARKQLYKLLDDVTQSYEPIQITGKRGSAELVSEDDWRAVQETPFLVSIPGMRESLLEGMAMPVAELEDELDWLVGGCSTPTPTADRHTRRQAARWG